jgi:hypothetical protein
MHRLPTLLVFFSWLAFGQVDPYVAAARSYRQEHELEVVKEFVSLLAIPNIAADPANLRRNAEAVRARLDARGVKTRLLERAGAPPVVLVGRCAPDGLSTSSSPVVSGVS